MSGDPPATLFSLGATGVAIGADEVSNACGTAEDLDAWRVAFRAQRAAAIGDELPSTREVALLGVGQPGRMRASYEGLRSALAAWDPDEARAWLRVLEDCDAPPEMSVLARAIVAWLIGESFAAAELADATTRFRAAGEAELLVDAASIASLTLLAAGEVDEAEQRARLASRMARAEGLPQSQYLANIALAIVRRRTHRPYLSLRILAALRMVASPRWSTWIRWEQLLSGHRPEGASGPGAAAALEEALTAASAGNREACIAALDRADVSIAAVPVRRELDVIRRVLTLPARADASAGEEFVTGISDRPPGLVLASVSGRPTALVFVSLDGPARRLLSPGENLLPPCPELEPTQRKRGRVECLVATLAFAGADGVVEADVFRAVYGFEFVPEIHAGTLRVLLHRARAFVEEVASIERQGERLRLVPTRCFRLTDPRCTYNLEEQLLATLSEGDVATAPAAAASIGVSVRRTQQLLQELCEDGIVQVEKVGRTRHYRVEDTTFREPTTWVGRRNEPGGS